MADWKNHLSYALAGLLSLAASGAGAAVGSDLVITVESGKSTYLLGEWVDVRVTKCNPTEEPITLTYSCPCCHDRLVVLDAGSAVISEAGLGCIQPVLEVSWEPGECKSDRFAWYQTAPEFATGDPVAEGRYRFQHVFQFPSFATTTLSSDVVVDVGLLPQATAFLDFETLSEGTPVPPGAVGAWYVSRNVLFSEAGYGRGQPVFARDGAQGGFVTASVASRPPVFNIVAEFALPVAFVAADVMTAADRFVTMTAYDLDGLVVGSVKSPPLTEKWKGKLSLRSSRGIARVEWLPSLPEAAVGIDNLELQPLAVVDVPTLDAIAVAALAVLIYWAGCAAIRRAA